MELLGSLAQIVIINIVLSGDNAVVIGMAAHALPPRQRRLAILAGGGAAIALRVCLTAVAAVLLGLPALKAIGGVLLLWIAFHLLEISSEEHESGKASLGLSSAITTIMFADLIMSLDNVLGVAAASGGNLSLLMFGLLFSMMIVMLGGSVIAQLIDRLWWLSYLGAGIIAWTGIEMALSDDVVKPLLEAVPEVVRLVIVVVVTVGVVVAAHAFHRRGPEPSRRAPDVRAEYEL